MNTFIKEAVEKALPELENRIKSYTGLDVTGRLCVELQASKRYDTHSIKIFSDSLTDHLNPLGRILFSEISIGFWGGTIDPARTTIWFNPKVGYTHPQNGTNGTQFLWDQLWFDWSTGEWIEGNIIL